MMITLQPMSRLVNAHTTHQEVTEAFLVDFFVCLFVCLFVCFFVWLVGWLVGWLFFGVFLAFVFLGGGGGGGGIQFVSDKLQGYSIIHVRFLHVQLCAFIYSTH